MTVLCCNALSRDWHKADLLRLTAICQLSEQSRQTARAGSVSIWRKWPTPDISRIEILQRTGLPPPLHLQQLRRRPSARLGLRHFALSVCEAPHTLAW